MDDAQLQAVAAALRGSQDQVVIDALAIRDDVTLTAWLNTPAASPFVVWRNYTPTNELANAILWANFTPLDAPDGTQLWLNRAMACQGKQFNIQNLLLAAQGSLQTGLTNVRQALNDALTGLPSGASGAVLSAGWAGANGVRALIQRNALRVEALFATGTGTTTNPGSLGSYEGSVPINEVSTALNRF